MKKSDIYTKKGDRGETSLVGGTRINKANEQIHLYGEVDELNSWIGVVVSHLGEKDQAIKDNLTWLQNKLFDLGSNLACESDKRVAFKLPTVDEADITTLESLIDTMDSKLEKLKCFILPGGTSAASFAHICRTITRRLERALVHFDQKNVDYLPEFSLMFINRLSDYFFVLARYLNFIYMVDEPKWVPLK